MAKKRMSQEGQVWSGIFAQGKWEKLLSATIRALREQGATEARLVGDGLADAAEAAQLDRPSGLSKSQALAVVNEFRIWARIAGENLDDKGYSVTVADLENQGASEATAIAQALGEGASPSEIVEWAKFAAKKLKG